MKFYNSKEYLEEQLKHKNYLEIAKENNVSKTTIQRKLHAFGLTTPRLFWAQKELQMLKEHYAGKNNIHTLFPRRTKSSVYHKAHKLRIPRPIRKRYNKVDESFFSVWTRESAYVLGWMFSDGNVTADKRTFRLHLNKKDLKIVAKIKKALKSNHGIKIHGDYLRFSVHSKKMCSDLIALGCGPKKAKKIRLPKIPQKYLSNFVRGYFDGDGSIHFNQPNTIKIKIVGNEKFIKDLKKTMVRIIKIRTSNVKMSSDRTWQIEFYGDNARILCKWMYKNCNGLCLDRKYLRFKDHLRKRGEKID